MNSESVSVQMFVAYSVSRWTTLVTFCWLWSSSHSSHPQHLMPEWWLCHLYCTSGPCHSTPQTFRVKCTMAEWSSTVTANCTMYVRTQISALVICGHVSDTGWSHDSTSGSCKCCIVACWLHSLKETHMLVAHWAYHCTVQAPRCWS